MPEITVSMAAGRTDEQKAGMMRDITQALVKNLGVDADAVVIQINEAPLAHKMLDRTKGLISSDSEPLIHLLEAQAALDDANGAATSAQERLKAERARADLAEACLAAVADVLRRLYASDDPTEGLAEAARELEPIAADCDSGD